MKNVLVLDLNQAVEEFQIAFRGEDVRVQCIGCGGDPHYFVQGCAEACARLSLIPASAKGVHNGGGPADAFKWALWGMGLAAAALIFSRRKTKITNRTTGG